MGRFANICATGFGAGYSPVAPGTAGTFAALCLLYLTRVFVTDRLNIPSGAYLIFLIILVIIGSMLCTEAERYYGNDSPKIVLDEYIGTWITFFAISLTWEIALVGFLLFRFFDITKLYPINKAESLPEGFGVMMDDVIAGIYAHICLLLYIYMRGL